MSQVQKKPNFLSQLIPFMVVFLAIQLILMRNQTPPDPRTSEVILSTMQDQCRNLYDVDIQTSERALESRLSQEVQAKTLTQAEADHRKLEGEALVAMAKLQGGLKINNIGKLEVSYQTLQNEWKKLQGTPTWTSELFQTPFGATTLSSMYDRSKDALNDANKKDLLYGFIPGYKVVDVLVQLTGSVPSFSYAMAALILAILVRASIYPLSQRQLLWGRQMSQLQPLAKEIKEKYKDPQEQGLKTMELYKEYGINPYGGCLPALVQLPLFLTVYRCMLHYRFQFVSGTFLWINPATATALKGLGFFAPAANLGLEDHALIVLYGISMVISTLLTPVSDPNNVRTQRMLGVGMSIFFAVTMLFGFFPVPAAFVLYWTFTNILATAQSLRAYRLPLPPLVKVNAATGGVYPVKPKKPGFLDMMRDAAEQRYKQSQPPTIEPPKGDDIQPYKPEAKMPKNGSLGGAKKAAHKPKKRK